MTKFRYLLTLIVILALAIPFSVSAAPAAETDAVESFTILHTNDFHGQLEAVTYVDALDGNKVKTSSPGAARVADKIKGVRTAVGADNVLLFDGGDMMQGSLLSNINKGEPVIAYYKSIGYDGVTFGNHEFDWGQTELGNRITQAEDTAGGANLVETINANITKKDTAGNCTWEPFNAAVSPYKVFPVAGGAVTVGVIGVGSIETPYITIAEATTGLCFRDPYEAITHYYDEVKALSDVLVVLSHNGFENGGYGYGFTVDGDKTLAGKLNTANKPVNLIIGGHSHSKLSAATMVGNTAVVQAYYNGRYIGRADMTFDTDSQAVGITWSFMDLYQKEVSTLPEDAATKTLVETYSSNPAYQTLINQEIGYHEGDLIRNYNGDSSMGSFVQDAVYGYLNTDGVTTNDVEIVFNNAGGIRADIVDDNATGPAVMTYGETFNVLPFGNQTIVGDLTGAQIMDLLNQSATLFKGALQVAGIRYDFYRYADALPGPQPWAWGAYNVEVYDKATQTWVALDSNKTYRVATNEFLAPAGQDGYTGFKYMTNISYWGDMLNQVNAFVTATYTVDYPYTAALDSRIQRNGTDTTGTVIPVTILHHNDSHGRLLKSGSYQGLTQLATVVNQERDHNPDRTLLVNLGDQVQGDSMMYYFKSAGLGYTADGALLPPELRINPMIAAMNALNYDAMVLGNHEFNFGSQMFVGTFKDATFELLGANVTDAGTYGINKAGIYYEGQPTPQSEDAMKVNVYDGKVISLKVTASDPPVKVALLGITNHRVPNYELPSNIPGLQFTNPLDKAAELVPQLQAQADAVVALTHIGFTEVPSSVEVDANVDTNLAATVAGVDAIIGGHSHTNPTSGQAPYKYLPAYAPGAGNAAVIISQAYRYNTNLGEVVLGFLPDGAGGYQVVSTAGRAVAIAAATTVEDASLVSLLAPYKVKQDAYNLTTLGQTTEPINTMAAFTEETNGANLQADASVWELETKLTGVDVDVHLSGAMTNSSIAAGATQATPVTLTVADMFTAMPYENSLLVLRMNGPQIKRVLERGYRNYFYYTYFAPDYGGYSHYTTCMIDTDKAGKITYDDTYPLLPTGNNVRSFTINDVPVDFTDAATYYNVSTVNYLAAGSCNFNDGGVSLWLDGPTIVADTQFYVRDAVINYLRFKTIVSPLIEGRLNYLFLDTHFFLPTVFR